MAPWDQLSVAHAYAPALLHALSKAHVGVRKGTSRISVTTSQQKVGSDCGFVFTGSVAFGVASVGC